MDTTDFLLPIDLPNYLYFDTESEAEAAQAQIAIQIGCEIVGVNALTGMPDPEACKTTRWATPVKAEDGKWAIPAYQTVEVDNG